VISILTLFIVIAASRPVNKNISTGAVIRAKRVYRAGRSLRFINYWRIIKPVVNLQVLAYERLERKNRIAAFRLGTHSLNPLKREERRRIRSRQVYSM